MKVSRDNLPCGKTFPVYCVEHAPVAGADGTGLYGECGKAEWYFRFSYRNSFTNGAGSAAIYAWVFLAESEDLVELIIDERDGLTDGVDEYYKHVSRSVFSQAKFVRNALPDAIRSWREMRAEADETAVLLPLEDRITIVNAKFVNDKGVQVAFDIAVDCKVVGSTLEWLDDDLNLVSSGSHLDANSDYRHAVADGLGDWRRYEEVSTDAECGVLGDIAEVVHDKLVDAVKARKEALLPELEDWWAISRYNGEAIYGWGSEAQAGDYCTLLDKREDREIDCYTWKPVSLADAVSLVHNREGFDLLDGTAALKAEMEAA